MPDERPPHAVLIEEPQAPLRLAPLTRDSTAAPRERAHAPDDSEADDDGALIDPAGSDDDETDDQRDQPERQRVERDAPDEEPACSKSVEREERERPDRRGDRGHD